MKSFQPPDEIAVRSSGAELQGGTITYYDFADNEPGAILNKALAMSAGARRRLLWQATWTLVGVIGPKRAIRCWDHLAEKGFRGAGDRFLRR